MKSKNIVMGILAHVDSGKTTLAENILYISGSIRKIGRVDHKDTFLDTYSLERERGITIFSKQAQFQIGDKKIALLDTPGHVDFSAEMERTLQVLDYAILVISAVDGIQGHTLTLWKLLKRYQIPTFIFINKMDLSGVDKEQLLKEIGNRLSDQCIDFSKESVDMYEQIAMCDELLMNEYLENGKISKEMIRTAIRDRKVYPCYFGAALKQSGVTEFLGGLEKYLDEKEYSDEFSARVYKITRDEQNNRLTHMKITGGELRAKDIIYETKDDRKSGEKVEQIRVYSGSQCEQISKVSAGMICAVTGLNSTFCGEGLGDEKMTVAPLLEPVLTYKVKNYSDENINVVYSKLLSLEEEIPELHVMWNQALQEIHVQVMGEIQIDILMNLILEKYGIRISFESGSILYKETIAEKVVGIGHFEPLRHYAEVQLVIEPLERGAGIEFISECSEDILDKNWQRLILSHLEEKKHIGVLVGAEITDVKIILKAGRSHLKHTESGDFREATYRAVRHGMKSASSVLLEPYYYFRLELPQDSIGRGMTDIQKMKGTFSEPLIENGIAVLEGRCPVVTMQNYHKEVIAYTRGQGKLSCYSGGYDLCHNADEIILERGYDSEKDVNNPTGSIFCAHGAGFYVPWDKVLDYAHLDVEKEKTDEAVWDESDKKFRKQQIVSGVIDQEEIEEIFARTFGNMKQKRNHWSKTITVKNDSGYIGKERAIKKDEYLLVDGYNIIFAWDELKELAKTNIDSARDSLMDMMSYYQGMKQCKLILVFDAYKVSGGKGSIFRYHNIDVVYTKEAETADQYIEKVSHELARDYHVTVATSDRLEQMIIWGAGAKRMSAQGLLEEIEYARKDMQQLIENQRKEKMNPLQDALKKLEENG